MTESVWPYGVEALQVEDPEPECQTRYEETDNAEVIGYLVVYHPWPAARPNWSSRIEFVGSEMLPDWSTDGDTWVKPIPPDAPHRIWSRT